MPPTAADEFADWDARVRDALGRYSESLLRRAAGSLFKIKIGQPAEELIDKAAETQTNAPVIDRRLRELPEPARAVLALVGLSRQPRWKVGHLAALAAAAGHPDGVTAAQTLLEAGLLFPIGDGAVPDFSNWFAASGGWTAGLFVHPAVAARARAEEPVASGVPSDEDETGRPATQSDGLEWPLRLAVVWQQVRAGPVRLTQSAALFKRDQVRLQADPLLAAPFADISAVAADAGLLAFDWASAAGQFADFEGEHRAAAFPPAWERGLWPTLTELYAAFFAVETWDPLKGYVLPDGGLTPTATAGLVILALMASGGRQPPEPAPSPRPKTPQGVDTPRSPGAWFAPSALAAWLWEHHPSWPAGLTKESQKSGGGEWVEAFLQSVAFPLRLVETDGPRFRLSEFGRHLLAGGPAPADAPAFPQTLLVQPNAEVLAYRQGLNPALIGTLSRFARWKGIGPACTLELNAEETYRGLESGLTRAEITHALERHGMRAVPPPVADLLRRWADKRERVTVYPSATLVEFASAAELDAAIARGVVAIRLTDRVGLTADGSDPDFHQLRLIGNRDYDAKPQRCVAVAPDGVTLSVDLAAADLLLDAEVVRLAEPLPGENGTRKYRLTPASLRRAVEQGAGLAEFDAWFTARTGGPLPAAARLFVVGPVVSPPTVETLLVVRVPTAEIADGLCQWPQTAGFLEDRLGPTALVVAEENLPAFREVLRELGIVL